MVRTQHTERIEFIEIYLTHSVDKSSTSPELMKVQLSNVRKSICDHAYKTMKAMHSGVIASQFCAGELAGKKDTCHGDSGGPLQVSQQSESMDFGKTHVCLRSHLDRFGRAVLHVPTSGCHIVRQVLRFREFTGHIHAGRFIRWLD